MATQNEIKTHIRAIEQTRQITNAMYLLSASKMKSTIKRADYNVRYMQRLRSTMKDIIIHTDSEIKHRYLDAGEKQKSALFIVISGDKGLCGGYNNNLLDFFRSSIDRYQDIQRKLAVTGIVGEEYFAQQEIIPDYTWRGVIQNPTMHNARTIAETVLDEFDSGRVDAVYVIFTRYKNSQVQTPDMIKLLPISEKKLSDVEVEYNYTGEMMFEPSPSEVLGKVVPQYVIAMIFNTLLQSSASEHAARMSSMQTATQNADEMLKELKAQYNMQRQLAITAELTEISATTQTLMTGDKK